MIKNLVFLLLTVLFFSACKNKSNVDLIIHHGNIYTVDSLFSIKEALAVKDGKIIAIGSNDEILNSFQSSNLVDLQGKSVYPGFIDAHCHFLGYGLGLQQVDLTGTKSFNEIISKVIEFANKQQIIPSLDGKNKLKTNNTSNNDWIIGRGWDQNDWDNKEFPNNKILDSLFPNVPVLLYRIDGHAALANTEALKRAGITNTTTIIGGDLIKENGKITGVLIDNSVYMVKNHLPKTTKEKLTKALLEAQANCLAMGLTTIDDAGLLKSDIDLIDELQKQHQLKIRMYVMLSDSAINYDYYLQHGPYKTDRLNIRSFKFYADGALGSRGACLKHDYTDQHNWKGFLLSEQKHFEEKAKLLANKGFQMNTHCIGDSAYHIILNAYKKAKINKNMRWRIEHAQVVSNEDISVSDEIIPSVQPTHATSDMYWAEERLGKERIKTAYAYKTLLNKCGVVALGTDFPVEDISPFKTFYAAVARKDSKGYPENGFQNNEALSREETLKGMTIWAAYSNFEEKEKGSLEKGKLADFIILDKDIMKCNINEVLNTNVLSTFINGERVYQAN